jgi:hypothetical protein
MRLALALAVTAGLAACDSPSPWLDGQQATVSQGGMTFGIHWRGDYAEAYRTNFMVRPRLSEVARNAALAIEQATGCKVRPATVKGDHAIITARIDCKGA